MKTKRKALLLCLCLTLGLVSCSGKDKTPSEFGDYGKNADSLIQNSEYTDNEKEPEQKTPIYKLPPENAAANACGDNLTWSYDNSAKTLTIEGSGEMWDFLKMDNGIYVFSEDLPWKDYNKKIEKIVFPEGLTRIGQYAFDHCYVRETELPSTLVKIDEYAFNNCDFLGAIVIPGNVKEISASAFYSSGLNDITICEGVTDIGNAAFGFCPVRGTLSLPGSLKNIGESLFVYGKMEFAEIPEGITTISSGMFGNCNELTTVKLPKSVTSIGAAAFGRKSNITDIYYAGSESKWENIEVGKYNDIFDTAVIHYNSK